jgi:hypothetical protein
MTPTDAKAIDFKARLGSLFEKVEEVRGFL